MTLRPALRARLEGMPTAMVCFSGGVDSSYLLAEALVTLGPERVLAFTAVSPSLDPDEADSARRLAASIGARHALVSTHELDDARYTKNPVDRCYFCKIEVYGAAVRHAHELGITHVLDGFNVDDRHDHRPGRKAARELGVLSPLDEVGFDKGAIRTAAKELGLAVWDKPALACLSSRFPVGTEITPIGLARIARAEKRVRELGFRVVRVRDQGGHARIEIGAEELVGMDRAVLARVLDAVLAAGFERAEIDPEGYVRGGATRG